MTKKGEDKANIGGERAELEFGIFLALLVQCAECQLINAGLFTNNPIQQNSRLNWVIL
jgi:hypothetical protein